MGKITLYNISDLHMGDGSAKDDFNADDDFIAFLDGIDQLENVKVVINGDFLETWQCAIDDIVRAHFKVIHRLQKMKDKVILIPGNHDNFLFDQDNFFGIPIYSRLVIGNVLIMHGHHFDLANSRFKWFGKAITKIGGFLEIFIHRDIDKWFEKLKNGIYRLGRHGSDEKYKKAALEYIAKWPNIKTIILGHTHKLYEFYEGDKAYLNCGTWTGNKRDVLVWEVES